MEFQWKLDRNIAEMWKIGGRDAVIDGLFMKDLEALWLKLLSRVGEKSFQRKFDMSQDVSDIKSKVYT